MGRIILLSIACLLTVASIAQPNKIAANKQQASTNKQTTQQKENLKRTVVKEQQPTLPTIPKYKATDVKALIDTSIGPLIINFWASWCGPCIREIPWFDSLIEKSGKQVKLVLVSLDFPEDYAKKLPAFVKKQQYKGEVVYLNEQNADYFIPLIDKKWSGAIPASIFVNNSKKYYELFNYQLTVKRFELELNKLID